MKNKIATGLIAAVTFQFLVLTGMYVKAAIPLWTGQEIKVKTIPVDPRSLFRGNYARLRYEFGRVDGKYFRGEEALGTGDVIYVTLKPGDNGLYEFSEAAQKKPTDKIFLRGRVISAKLDDEEVTTYQVNYGIDAFFAPKEKALSLEKELQDGGIAVLMVGKDGRARIKDIIK
jgi:uncharacterized membrane-anchored protein